MEDKKRRYHLVQEPKPESQLGMVDWIFVVVVNVVSDYISVSLWTEKF